MRLLICLFLLTTLLPFNGACENVDSLAVNLIPESLKKDADAVVRDYHMEVQIVSPHEMIIKEQIIITILDQKGARYALLKESYDKLSKITALKGWLYDQYGAEIRKVKKNEVKDVSRVSVNFFDDDRYKLFDFNYSSYPYTVVFEKETSTEYTLFLPPWQPQTDYDCAVQHADLQVFYPVGTSLRYKTTHMNAIPDIVANGDDRIMKLSVSQLKAFSKPDDLTPQQEVPFPSLIMAADNFGMQELSGTMNTWQHFGAFFYDLNKDRDMLPDDKKSIVHLLADTCKTAKQKVIVLYDYLKQNTRYVSIQLGIGGWQTLDAGFVSEKGYGDCKALSNYMMALLKEAGVTSYCALVYAGERDRKEMQVDFPYNAFDHVILCVPLKEDTVWLECTAKHLPAGYLSSFTDDRNVLLLTPNGGVVVKTPCNADKVNLLNRKAELTIQETNDVRGFVDAAYKGYMWEEEAWMVNEKTKSEVDKHLNRFLAMPNYNVVNYKVENSKGAIPSLTETVSIVGSGIASRNGNSLFITPQIFKAPCRRPSTPDERKTPFELFQSYCVTDTVLINLPGVYAHPALPPVSDIEYSFGSLHSEVLLEKNNSLKIVTTYRQKKGVYPADKFIDYLKFCDQANNGVGDIVLVKTD